MKLLMCSKFVGGGGGRCGDIIVALRSRETCKGCDVSDMNQVASFNSA